MDYQIHPNRIRQILFLVVLLLLFWLISKELLFMLNAFLGAITMYVLLRNQVLKMLTQNNWKKWTASTLMILLIIVLIVLPTYLLVNFGVNKILPFVKNPDIIKTYALNINTYINSHFNINVLSEATLEKINPFLLKFAQKTIGETFSTLGTIAIMLFILYFMFYNTLEIELWLKRSLPFKNSNVQTFINKLRSLVYSNAIGIPITAIAQGLIGLVGYWIFGVHEFILMGLLTALSSVIPVVGTMAVYVPLGIYQLSVGNTWQGVAILLWGFIVIGASDNIVRFMVQKKLSNVHPMVTIFGVIIGVNLFGFMGIIFGPIIISIFALLVEIYVDEYGIADADDVENLKS